MSGNTVHVSLSLRGEATVTAFVHLKEVDVLQSLENFAGQRLGRETEVGWLGTTALATTIDFLESLYSCGSTDVQVTDGGSTAGVEPVRLIWRKLLELGGLDDVTEFWDNKLSRLLKVSCESSHELLLVDVFNTCHGELKTQKRKI